MIPVRSVRNSHELQGVVKRIVNHHLFRHMPDEVYPRVTRRIRHRGRSPGAVPAVSTGVSIVLPAGVAALPLVTPLSRLAPLARELTARPRAPLTRRPAMTLLATQLPPLDSEPVAACIFSACDDEIVS